MKDIDRMCQHRVSKHEKDYNKEKVFAAVLFVYDIYM